MGTPGFAEDPQALASLLGRHDELAAWLAEQGQTVSDTSECLAFVDDAIDGWTKRPDIAPMLANVVGPFLGSVLARTVDGARWHVWPNGHPVVRLKGGHEYDVVDLVARRIGRGEPRLPAVLAEAKNRSC